MKQIGCFTPSKQNCCQAERNITFKSVKIEGTSYSEGGKNILSLADFVRLLTDKEIISL